MACGEGVDWQGRDGGTGRRSGLKIRRPSGLGGSTPPPGTNRKNLPIDVIADPADEDPADKKLKFEFHPGE